MSGSSLTLGYRRSVLSFCPPIFSYRRFHLLYFHTKTAAMRLVNEIVGQCMFTPFETSVHLAAWWLLWKYFLVDVMDYLVSIYPAPLVEVRTCTNYATLVQHAWIAKWLLFTIERKGKKSNAMWLGARIHLCYRSHWSRSRGSSRHSRCRSLHSFPS